MEQRYAWLQHMVRRGKFVLKYIPTTEKPADFLTKALHFPAFNRCSVAIGQVRLANVADGDDEVQLEPKREHGRGVLTRMECMHGRSSRLYAVRELHDGLRQASRDCCAVAIDQGARRPSFAGKVNEVVADPHKTDARLEPLTRSARRLQLTELVDGWAVNQEE
ncbi:unnamed protein product [Closterium sp. NIES-53]